MRRRLWCHINTIDVRSAEDLGIGISNFDPSADTAFPLNINDSDITPDMVSLPAAQIKWTEMTLSLIKIETAYVSQRAIQSVGSPWTTMPDHSLRTKQLKELASHLEYTYIKHCDENIPLQRATIMSTRALISKLEFLLQHQPVSMPPECLVPKIARIFEFPWKLSCLQGGGFVVVGVDVSVHVSCHTIFTHYWAMLSPFF